MKKIFFLAIAMFLTMFIYSCKDKNNDDDNQNNQDTSGLANILPADWQGEVVDSGSFQISNIKIAIDKNKGIHILYYAENVNENMLKYAYKPIAGTWQIQTVRKGVECDYFDLGVSSSTVYAVFNDDNENSKLHLSQSAIGSGSWNDNIISDDASDRYPAIFIDNNDKVHISYSRANDWIAYYTIGQDFDTVSKISEAPSDIVVDKFGTIHIFFTQNYDFYHSYSNDGTTWTTEKIYTNTDEYLEKPSAAVDTNGNISVIMSLNMVSNNIEFFYRKYGENNFNHSQLDYSRVGYGNIEICVDLSGKQYFSVYEDGDEFCVLLGEKKNTATKWDYTYLLNDPEYTYGVRSAIAADKDYGLHIAANGTNKVDGKLYYIYREAK
jgi:hypothetical protein